MSRNSLDKLHIELYIDGVFQGYAKHVSLANRKVDSTPDKMDALYFSTQQAANNVCDKIMNITHGCISCRVS